MARPAGYVPAAGHDWLLPFYDPLQRWILRERVYKTRLVQQAEIAPGQRVLDLGCGTATLTLLLERLQPGARVHGLDGDPKALRLARRKRAAAGSRIPLVLGLADRLPFADRCFDRVVSSLVFHHLTREEKLRALREVWRVLRPGGSLHVVDLGRPASRLGRLLVRAGRRGERLGPHLEGRFPELVGEAGFSGAQECGHLAVPGASLSFTRGSRAG
jgi:ubiquinone/menaquinone biosynthesis C-methylase UbiE